MTFDMKLEKYVDWNGRNHQTYTKYNFCAPFTLQPSQENSKLKLFTKHDFRKLNSQSDMGRAGACGEQRMNEARQFFD